MIGHRLVRGALALLVLASLAAVAQEHSHMGGADAKLGTVHFQTSCSPAAQEPFDRGVALLHSFQFGPATAMFEAASQADPGCAMAHWGVALCRWGNPFAPGLKPAAAMRQGQEAIARARAAAARTQRERDYIEAAAHLYDKFQSASQQSRVDAYSGAMAVLAARYRDDTEAQIFYALSLSLSADPADKTYARQLKAGGILEKLFVQQPNHPGLAHYIIHSYDVPTLAPRALDAAHRYARIAPDAPHALHMPSHTFTRVGAWQDSIDTNIAAAAAARREGQFAEELHASDYQVYAYLQTAQDAAARRLLDSLPEMAAHINPNSAPAGAAPPSAAFFALAAIPARYALERGDWPTAAKLEPRPSSFPYTDAITWFARGLGAARSGDAATARVAVEALNGLRDRLKQANENYWANQVEIQRRNVSAWTALADGKSDEALSGMRTAVQMEDATEKSAITPGPLAPARELLGEMLLQLKRPAEALQEFEATLSKEPNRFRALYGAAHAAQLAGDRPAARKYAATLLKVCERADQPGRTELAEARAIAGPERAGR